VPACGLQAAIRKERRLTLPMPQATFRFYAELNDFLPPARRQVAFEHAFLNRASVKDRIESLGVPHTEVDLILANGVSVDFSYIVQDGDRVSVYPVFEAVDIMPVVQLRPTPLREPRFVLDAHLGRLAAYLRLLGFDSLYRNDYNDDELAAISVSAGKPEEKRILLSRDRGLLKRRSVTHGYCVRSTAPRQQIVEIMARFDLARLAAPFRRCLSCNGLLETVAKEAVIDALPPLVQAHYQDFYRCTSCARLYWRGSHYAALTQIVAEVLLAQSTHDHE
jgi:uncharacterized protein with PIN domain